MCQTCVEAFEPPIELILCLWRRETPEFSTNTKKPLIRNWSIDSVAEVVRGLQLGLKASGRGTVIAQLLDNHYLCCLWAKYYQVQAQVLASYNNNRLYAVQIPIITQSCTPSISSFSPSPHPHPRPHPSRVLPPYTASITDIPRPRATVPLQLR